MKEIVKLEKYRLAPDKSGSGIFCDSLTIYENEIISIKTDDRDDAALLLKGLATLSYPVSGFYRFCNEVLDFSDYRNLLSSKRNIGYIGQESTMLSNRTVRQNMLLSRQFFENNQNTELEDGILELCDYYKITEYLDLRPSEMTRSKIKAAISLRALMKKPRLLVMEKPEDYMGYDFVNLMDNILSTFLKNSAVVFFSGSRSVCNSFKKSDMTIKNGVLTGK